MKRILPDQSSALPDKRQRMSSKDKSSVVPDDENVNQSGTFDETCDISDIAGNNNENSTEDIKYNATGNGDNDNNANADNGDSNADNGDGNAQGNGDNNNNANADNGEGHNAEDIKCNHEDVLQQIQKTQQATQSLKISSVYKYTDYKNVRREYERLKETKILIDEKYNFYQNKKEALNNINFKIIDELQQRLAALQSKIQKNNDSSVKLKCAKDDLEGQMEHASSQLKVAYKHVMGRSDEWGDDDIVNFTMSSIYNSPGIDDANKKRYIQRIKEFNFDKMQFNSKFAVIKVSTILEKICDVSDNDLPNVKLILKKLVI